MARPSEEDSAEQGKAGQDTGKEQNSRDRGGAEGKLAQALQGQQKGPKAEQRAEAAY